MSRIAGSIVRGFQRRAGYPQNGPAAGGPVSTASGAKGQGTGCRGAPNRPFSKGLPETPGKPGD